MPENKGKHLTLEDRQVIEDALRDGLGCRATAARLHVAPSTVSREVEQNRTATLTKRKDFKPAKNCARYAGCEEVGTACASCSTYKTRCRSCRTRKCTELCGKFELRTCPDTQGWPWTCPPRCPRSAGCTYPRMRYSAQAAQNSYEARLVSAREGVSITPEQMAAMMLTVDKLVRQGWSVEAIYAEHGGEMPVGVRTCYTYIERGFAGVSNIDLPRKVRYKPRKKKPERGRDRVDRAGRTFDDFRALPVGEQALVVHADTVVGFEWNSQRILTLHLVRHAFQFNVLQADGAAGRTVAAFDAIECCADRLGGEVVAAGLVDGHGHPVDVVDALERPIAPSA